MDTYLLLRSNKKSGPYSLDQLVNFGLKPYDLVWVEGKSAAWRYPSEVDLLKEYAPSVEEQPFDRFFKKTTEERAIVKPPTKQEQVPEAPIEVKPVITSGKVFVSMPENQLTRKPVQPTLAKAQVVIEEKVDERKAMPVRNPIIPEEKKEERKPLQVKEEPALNEKYSESLDDIKKRYTETYLNRKNKSKWTSTYTSIMQVVGGAIFFCVLVVVAYKNFSGEDKPDKGARTTIIQPEKSKPVDMRTTSNPPLTISPVITETNNQETKTPQVLNEKIKNQDEDLNTDRTLQKNDIAQNEKKELTPVENKPEKKAVMPKPELAETNTEDIKAKPHAVNITNLVNVKANKYKQRAFGGVLNLELTVNNESKFALDKVVVELQYLKPSEQPLKTEKIVFNSVAPGGSQTLKIPDYLRGVKVTYKITGIESSQYERYTAGL